MLRKPSITTWPASVPVKVEFWPEASRASANMVLAPVTPSRGVSRFVSVVDLGHVGLSTAVEGGGGHDQDGGIHQQCEGQGDRGIDGAELDRLPLALRCCARNSGSAPSPSADTRLCGITVAPRMPIAIYSMPGSRTICARERKPMNDAQHAGLGKQNLQARSRRRSVADQR